MKNLAFKIGMGYLRTALATYGGALVAHGMVSQSNEQAIVGGIIALATAIWSHYSKLPDSTDK